MTSNRPYGRAIAPAEAISELRRNAGSQFDPAVIEAFCSELEGQGLDVGSHATLSPQASASLPA
jgi:polar amino acid transport system substrate-binding protein